MPRSPPDLAQGPASQGRSEGPAQWLSPLFCGSFLFSTGPSACLPHRLRGSSKWPRFSKKSFLKLQLSKSLTFQVRFALISPTEFGRILLAGGEQGRGLVLTTSGFSVCVGFGQIDLGLSSKKGWMWECRDFSGELRGLRVANLARLRLDSSQSPWGSAPVFSLTLRWARL